MSSTSPEREAPFRLLSLPAEILVMIMERMDDEADMNSFCRTDHLLYDLLISHLYRHNASHSYASALHWAMVHGQEETAIRSLRAGADIDCIHPKSTFPLLNEAFNYDRDRLFRLADGFGRGGRRAFFTPSPLLECIRRGLLNPAKMLLEKGARILEKEEMSIIHSLDHKTTSLLPILKEKGLNIDIKNASGLTALWFAVERVKPETAEALLCHGADPMMGMEHEDDKPAGERRWSEMHKSCLVGDLGSVQALLKSGADIDPDSRYAKSPLQVACIFGHLDIATTLLQAGADIYGTQRTTQPPLQLASTVGNVAMVRLLLQHGAKTSGRDNGSSSRVSEESWASLTMACRNGHMDVVKLLLEHHDSVNGVDYNDETPLQAAISCSHAGIARILLEHGADVSWSLARAKPLYIAASRNDVDMARLLLDYNADPDHHNRYRQPALHVAAERGHLETFQLLQKYGANIHLRSHDLQTVMHRAAKGGSMKMVEYLIDNRVSIMKKDNNEVRPIYYAAKSGCVKIMERLIELGSPINCVAKNGRTLLHETAQSGFMKATELLLAYGADPTAKRGPWGTPADVATNPEMKERLEQAEVEWRREKLRQRTSKGR